MDARHYRFASCACTQALSVCSVCLLVAATGCAFLPTTTQATATTIGEITSGYTYIPIDPTKVHIEPGICSLGYSDIGDGPKQTKLLDMLPDNAVRMSMEISDSRGSVTYSVAKASASGLAYKLTADYVNSDTVNKSVWIRKTMLARQTKTSYDEQGEVSQRDEETRRVAVQFGQNANEEVALSSEKTRNAERRFIQGTEQYDVKSFVERPSSKERDELSEARYAEFNVPVYVGIGLRIVAEGMSLSSDANISGIGVVGAEAEAKRLLGSLTVQTLGVNSQAVASALPVQSELSRTTAENAFVAIGSIKAMLHQPETRKFPRVVGLYLPFPGGKPLVNALISELSRTPVTWCPGGQSINDKPTTNRK